MSLRVLSEPQILPARGRFAPGLGTQASCWAVWVSHPAPKPPSPSLAPPLPDFALYPFSLPSKDSVTQLFHQSECQPQFPCCFPPSLPPQPRRGSRQGRFSGPCHLSPVGLVPTLASLICILSPSWLCSRLCLYAPGIGLAQSCLPVFWNQTQWISSALDPSLRDHTFLSHRPPGPCPPLIPSARNAVQCHSSAHCLPMTPASSWQCTPVYPNRVPTFPTAHAPMLGAVATPPCILCQQSLGGHSGSFLRLSTHFQLYVASQILAIYCLVSS